MGGVTQLPTLSRLNSQGPYLSPPELGNKVGGRQYPDVRHVPVCVTVKIRVCEHGQEGDSLPRLWVFWHKESTLRSGMELLLLAVGKEHTLTLFAHSK